jgi:hypothetical protein
MFPYLKKQEGGPGRAENSMDHDLHGLRGECDQLH